MKSENALEHEIAEIKAMLSQICKVLGVGATPPAQIFDLKKRARKLIELKAKNKKS